MHEEHLPVLPAVEGHGFDEGSFDAILSVFACAVVAEVDAEVKGGPFGIFLFAIYADLGVKTYTLFSLMFFISAKALSLTASSIGCH